MLNSFQRMMVFFGFVSCLVFFLFPLYDAYRDNAIRNDQIASLH